MHGDFHAQQMHLGTGAGLTEDDETITLNGKLLTVKDVAERLSVHPKTVWRWVSEGRIQAPIYLGRRVPRWPINSRLTPDARLPATAGYQKIPVK